MVAFDLWLMNVDRHDQNIRARKVQNQPDEYTLVMIDHSHVLVSPNKAQSDPTLLNDRVDYYGADLLRSNTSRQAITDSQALDESMESIRQVRDEAINVAVARVPERWLSPDAKLLTADFVKKRRDLISSLAGQLKPDLPNLA